jgi:hypothetical protein
MTIPFSIFGFTNSAILFSPSHQINPLVPSVSLSLSLWRRRSGPGYSRGSVSWKRKEKRAEVKTPNKRFAVEYTHPLSSGIKLIYLSTDERCRRSLFKSSKLVLVLFTESESDPSFPQISLTWKSFRAEFGKLPIMRRQQNEKKCLTTKKNDGWRCQRGWLDYK